METPISSPAISVGLNEAHEAQDTAEATVAATAKDKEVDNAPPYTIYSPVERWAIVTLAAAAGLFRQAYPTVQSTCFVGGR